MIGALGLSGRGGSPAPRRTPRETGGFAGAPSTSGFAGAPGLVGVAAYLLAALLVGCASGRPAGGGAEPAPTSVTLPFGVQEVRLVVADFRFDPSELNVVAGSRVIITAQNESGRLHNLTLVDAEQGRRVFSVDVAAGGLQRIDFTPERPGVFILYCDELGHRALGEQGVVRVSPRP
jgi:plastocyanin